MLTGTLFIILTIIYGYIKETTATSSNVYRARSALNIEDPWLMVQNTLWRFGLFEQQKALHPVH